MPATLAASAGPAVDGNSYDGWASEFEAFAKGQGRGRSPGTGAPSSSEMAPAAGGAGALKASAGGATAAAAAVAAAGPAPGGAKAIADRSMVEDLQAEMKLLHWHKLANEAALKAAIIKTKQIKSAAAATGDARGADSSSSSYGLPRATTPGNSKSLNQATSALEERAVWMQQVIMEEQSKPLHVSADFIASYEEKERITEDKLDREVQSHIHSLRRLRDQVEKREELNRRRQLFKAQQRQLEKEKVQLLKGKAPKADAGSDSAAATGGDGGKDVEAPVVGALDTVLGSLDKLLELEKRISSLETTNLYDDAKDKEKDVKLGPLGARKAPATMSKLQFSRKRQGPSLNTPGQMYYTAAVKKVPIGGGRGVGSLAGGTLQSKSAGARGGTRGLGASTRATQSGSSRNRPKEDGGTFLTSLPDVGGKSGGRRGRIPGHGRGEMAAARNIGYRSAIMEQKRSKAKQRMAKERAEALRIARQDKVIRGWLETKKTQSAAARVAGGTASSTTTRGSLTQEQRRAGRGRPGAVAARGMAAGRQEKNAHMQQFSDMRAEYSKRKEDLRKAVNGGGRNGARAGPRAISRRAIAVGAAANSAQMRGRRPLHLPRDVRGGGGSRAARARSEGPLRRRSSAHRGTPLSSKNLVAAGRGRARSVRPTRGPGARSVASTQGVGAGVRAVRAARERRGVGGGSVKFSAAGSERQGGVTRLPVVAGAGVRSHQPARVAGGKRIRSLR